MLMGIVENKHARIRERGYVKIVLPEEAERRAKQYHEIHGGADEEVLRGCVNLMTDGRMEAYLHPETGCIYWMLPDDELRKAKNKRNDTYVE